LYVQDGTGLPENGTVMAHLTDVATSVTSATSTTLTFYGSVNFSLISRWIVLEILFLAKRGSLSVTKVRVGAKKLKPRTAWEQHDVIKGRAFCATIITRGRFVEPQLYHIYHSELLICILLRQYETSIINYEGFALRTDERITRHLKTA